MPKSGILCMTGGVIAVNCLYMEDNNDSNSGFGIRHRGQRRRGSD